MIGFLTKEQDVEKIIKNDEFLFVHVPDNLSIEEVKICLTKQAFCYAEKLNLNEVFLYFGKDIIKYEFSL